MSSCGNILLSFMGRFSFEFSCACIYTNCCQFVLILKQRLSSQICGCSFMVYIQCYAPSLHMRIYNQIQHYPCPPPPPCHLHTHSSFKKKAHLLLNKPHMHAHLLLKKPHMHCTTTTSLKRLAERGKVSLHHSTANSNPLVPAHMKA